jgi:hypothetical protein
VLLAISRGSLFEQAELEVLSGVLSAILLRFQQPLQLSIISGATCSEITSPAGPNALITIR